MASESTLMNGDTKELVVSALESDQLSSATRVPLPRRKLSRFQLAVVWSLRIYLIFMIAVVIYQVWATTR